MDINSYLVDNLIGTSGLFNKAPAVASAVGPMTSPALSFWPGLQYQAGIPSRAAGIHSTQTVGDSQNGHRGTSGLLLPGQSGLASQYCCTKDSGLSKMWRTILPQRPTKLSVFEGWPARRMLPALFQLNVLMYCDQDVYVCGISSN